MRTISLRPAVLAFLALLPAGCASSGGARAPDPAPASSSEAAAASPAAKKAVGAEGQAVTPRAQRLFDEAVAAPEEFKKLKVPTDWEVLERRWRAVLAAEELPEAWFNLGVVLEQRQRPDEARAAYQQALRLRSSFGQAAANLAVLEEPGDPRRAAAAYQEVLRKFPDDAVARVRLGSIYLKSGQLDEAWRFAREALVRDPKTAGAYKVMMRVALERGNTDLAELIAIRAQKLGGQDPEIASFMGDIQAKRGDAAAAAAQYRKALALRPDDMHARLALLATAVKTENWDGVAEQARAVLQKEPDNAGAHLALGVALRYGDKVDQALAEYDKAERLAGGRLPEVHLAKGVVLMKLKNSCEPAIAEFKAYISTAGALAGHSSAFQLQRECEQIVAANRQAEEAVRQMQAEAEKKKAEEVAKKKAEEAAKRAVPIPPPPSAHPASGPVPPPASAHPASGPAPPPASARPASGPVPPPAPVQVREARPAAGEPRSQQGRAVSGDEAEPADPK